MSWATGFLVMIAACSEPQPSAKEGDRVELEYRFTVQPGEEAWRCKVSDLPTSTWLNVNHVESVQNDTMHHMDLMAIALAAPDLQPGEYDCGELYAQYPALMDDGVTFYASQRATQEITLPPGTVAELLPRLRVMHEIHFINPTDAPVEAFSRVDAYAYPPEEVVQSIWGGAVRDREIAIPAGATSHVEWTRCVMDKAVDVLFLSTHTHERATKAQIRHFDGSVVGELIYTNTDWHAPPLEDYTATPLRIPAGAGFEFACDYANSGSAEVNWGFSANDEMCQIAIVYTPGDSQAECVIVEQGVR
ncbi:MAG: hypothetical protein SFX73_21275 [Kofleriaceae bacterium]|nr:hypothetical protein [Kofleriaceae bacterium]